ncbi:MAG: calcium-binding protein, partial [Cyanobacteriota bacterium]|nr:calcium-binding protein [Cyanobacteriota bacterium]
GLDFESDKTHNITVRTTDDGDESFEQQLTINVTDVDETPPEPENAIYGSDNNDYLRGGSDNDTIYGEGGNDLILGRKGDDLLNGDSGNDRIYGGSGNDILNGNSGNDRINSGSGNDILNGGSGNDIFNGGSGNDILNGGSGNDILIAGGGMDTLTGVDITSAQPGYNEIDILRGNADADLFILGDDSQVYYTGNGINDYARIDTFNGSQGDRIQLQGSSGDYTLEENVPGLPKGTAIYNNDDLVGIVKNVRNMDLNSSDFSFV